MAGVRRNEHLVVGFTGEVALAVGELTVLERAVDADLVLVVGELAKRPVAQTEAPGFAVIRRPIGNPVRALGNRREVLLQLGKSHARAHRSAVVDDVQVAWPGSRSLARRDRS